LSTSDGLLLHPVDLGGIERVAEYREAVRDTPARNAP
jgi:hypothetical protein